MAGPLQPCNSMDIAQDSTETRMCAIECPLCKKRYVTPIVFNTHLLAHLNYYNKRWPGLFACTLCEFTHENITKVSLHIEKIHAAKYRIRIDSAVANQLLADNDQEKNRFIQLLGNHPLGNPLSLPFNYPRRRMANFWDN